VPLKDGKVVFLSTRGGVPALYVGDAKDPAAPARALATIDERVRAFTVLPDERTLLFPPANFVSYLATTTNCARVPSQSLSSFACASRASSESSTLDAPIGRRPCTRPARALGGLWIERGPGSRDPPFLSQFRTDRFSAGLSTMELNAFGAELTRGTQGEETKRLEFTTT
jgi:hypothetical protein